MANDTEALDFLQRFMPESIEVYKSSITEILEYVRNNSIGYQSP